MNKKYFILIILTILTYLGIVLYSDYKQVLLALSQFNMLYILPILILVFFNYLLRSIKWHYLSRQQKIKISFHDSFMIFFCGLGLSFTPAKSGELIKSYFLKKIKNISYKRSLPMIIVERLTDLFAMILLCIIGIYGFYKNYYLMAYLILIILLIVFIIEKKSIVYFIFKLLKKIKFLKKPLLHAKKVYEGTYVLSRPKILIPMTILSFISWFLECLATYFIITLFGYDISILAAVLLFSLPTIIGALSTLPGGVIVAETSMFGMLISLNISEPHAGAIVLLTRAATLWFAVILGLIAFFIFNKTKESLINKSKLG